MRNLAVLFIHFVVALARLLGPGGVRSLVAESLLLKHQLLVVNRSRHRSPNLSSSDRILAGWMALLVRPTRLLRSAIVLKPSTLLALHQAMSKRKYRMLFSPKRRRKPGPKGPSAELIQVVVEMKQRNPTWGCPRIAQQMASAFNIQIDKDVVRRILAHHYLPGQDSDVPTKNSVQTELVGFYRKFCAASLRSGGGYRHRDEGRSSQLFPLARLVRRHFAGGLDPSD
jgi:hypothetical protein